MKRNKLFSLVLFILILLPLALTGQYGSGSSPKFYLGTDKSFGEQEIPYVNLEGPGSKPYEFRVYQVKEPDKYLAKKVKERLVKEKNNKTYGNPFAIFKKTLQTYKKDMRKIARREFNVRTRSHIKRAMEVDFNKYEAAPDVAMPGLLPGHRFLVSFSIPKTNASWVYRRVPVPIKNSGVYLIEVVSGTNLGYTLVVKSNINFLTKQADKETLIYAAARDTGVPLDQATISIIDGTNGKTISTGKTNKSGVMSYKGKSRRQSLIIVKKGEQYTISDPNFYAKSFYGTGGVRTFIYTDRPIYRPGDEVFFKGIVRNYKNDKYKRVTGGAKATVITEKGDTVIDSIPVTLSGDMGTFVGTFTLPDMRDQYLGTYNIVLDYQGKSYSTEFSVEAYKKPPFLVKVKTGKRSYVGKENVPVTITAKFYFGEPVSGESVHYRVFRRLKYDFSPVGQLPYFEEAAEYLGFRQSDGKRDLVLDKTGTLDSNGTLKFTMKPDKFDKDYTYTVMATVTSSSATLSGSTSFSVNRSAFFIKVKRENMVYSPGDTVKIEALLMAFDKTLKGKGLKKVVGGRKIKGTLYTRSFHSISQESKRKKVTSKKVKTDGSGKGILNFKLPGKGHFIVKFEAKDPGGKTTTAETTLWASGKNDSIQVPFKNLTLKPSRDIYSVGDYADILILSPVADGSIFVSLEGNRIFKHETLKLNGNTYKYRVKITSAMTPNFTISVSQFHANELYKSQMKIVAPPQEKFLRVRVTPDRSIYKPGGDVVLKVETLDYKKRGVPAEVSLSVVDEAIYQLQADRNPKMGTYFYHPRRNNVNTTVSSAYRFFGYAESRRLKLALNRKGILPLGAIKEEAERSREKFKDTTFWDATVKTDKRGKATIKFTLAENLTTWRVTARAVTADTKVGEARAKFLARRDLMLVGGIPRYMIRGDKQKVAANVSNYTKNPLKTKVTISAKDAKIIGKKEYVVDIAPGKSEQLYFTVEPSADPKKAVAEINLQARGGTYFDGAKHKVPLTYFGLPRSVRGSVRLASGDDSDKAVVALPASYADPKLTLRLSPGSGEALRQSLAYLTDYPYGCIEQTMSRFMPLLAAKKAGFISPRLKNELPKMIKQGLFLIKSHQGPDGGFGWYGGQKSNPMMTAYVYRGLAICKKLHGKVEDSMITKARRFLYRQVDSTGFSKFEKAYILFCLSEGGKIEKSMIDKLVDDADDMDAYGKALTSLILINQGEKSKGTDMFVSALEDSKFSNKPELTFASLGDRNNWREDSVEITASLLLAAVRLNRDQDLAENLASLLLVNRHGHAWKNSRDTAMAVLALSEKLERFAESGESSTITVSVNGKKIKTFTANPKDINKGDAVIAIPGSRVKAGDNTISIEKKAGVPLYASAILTFFDKSKSFDPIEKGFSVSREYHKVETEESDGGLKLSTSETKNFNVGDLVMISMKVSKAKEAGSFFLIEDPILPGFSFVNKDSEYYSGDRKRGYDERQIYDERAVFFLAGPTREDTVRYFLRAEIPGTYRSLPAKASLMYYPDVYGGSEDTEVVIK
ncbi:MAG: alpha-2-macroglobulin [bacterium]|nr:alpha-2-macroglobulin [bacterium]